MGNKLKIIMLVTLALFSFCGFSALLLWKEGKLNSEGLKNIPLLGGSKAISKEIPDIADKKASSAVKTSFSLPSPFSFEEITVLASKLQETKAEYERKIKSLEADREEVLRMKKDVEERKQEVQTLMEKVTVLLGELEEKKRSWKEERAVSEASEQQNVKKIAKMFASMDASEASERISQMETATSAKILSSMTPKSASKILSLMATDKVKVLTELMQKTP